MKHSDVRRSDEAAVMIEACKDILSGSTPTQIYQVCANIVGAVVVEMAGRDRQAVLDETIAFGNIIGRVVETTLIQMEEAEDAVVDGHGTGDAGPKTQETDEDDTDVS